jgi:regulatory protein
MFFVRVKGAGRRNIASGLIRKGIPREVVSAALEGIDDGSEEARADDLARARARRLRDLEPRVALQRLTAYLARRGYEVETARTAARRALETHEATE